MIEDRDIFTSGARKENISACRDAKVLHVVPEDDSRIVVGPHDLVDSFVIGRIVEKQELEIFERLIEYRLNHFAQDRFRRVVERG